MSKVTISYDKEKLKALIEAFKDVASSVEFEDTTPPVEDPDPIPDPDPTPDPQPKDQFTGVAVSGLEFAESKIPGKLNQDYRSNPKKVFDDLKTKNLNIFRIPFLSGRLFNQNGTFNTEYLNEIKKNIEYAGKAWLDPHDYAKFHGHKLGTSGYTKDMFLANRLKLANEFKNDDRVECIELDNEPNALESFQFWYEKCNAAITGMREQGWNKLIGIPVYHWSAVDNFFDIHGQDFKAPIKGDNLVYIFHDYFNKGNTGYDHPANPNEPAQIHVQRLQKVIDWARKEGVKIAITEFGVPATQAWVDNIKPWMQTIKENDDVIIGKFYWAGGDWYSSQTAIKDVHLQLLN